MRGRCRRSSGARLGVRSAAAGWYSANTERVAARRSPDRRAGPSRGPAEIRAPGMNRAIECRPSVTISAGSSTSSWRWRYGAQAAISSGSGSRLSGGRHLTTFVMKTSSRRQPSVAEELRQEVAGATDERPALPVLVEARALADEHDLGVGAALAGDRVRPRLGEPAARAGADLGGDRLERRPALVRGSRRRPRSPRPPPSVRRARRGRAAGRTQPRSTSTSAIWTAFVAAPLRRLSLTTQNARPRPSGDRRVLADAADEDVVGAGRLASRAGRSRSTGRPGRRRRGPPRTARRRPVRGDRRRGSRRGRPPSGRRRPGTRTAVQEIAQVRQVEDLAALA